MRPARLLILLLATSMMARAADRSTCLVAIDHMPLAVKNVDAAADIYSRLGFALKPGRVHQNGIRNEHIKFVDGAGIELITAPRAVDPLTSNHVRLLSQGEGPALVSFRTSSLAEVKSRLVRRGYPLKEDGDVLEIADERLNFVFIFGGNNLSPTDRPEHFRHTNSAYATIGVWIADGEQSPLIRLLRTLGAEIVRKKVFVPTETLATVAVVENGEVIFLPASRQVVRGRQIIGTTFATRDLAALRRLLGSSGVPVKAEIKSEHYESIVLAPKQTVNLLLEFRSKNEDVRRLHPGKRI